jgi:hypothetical protein
MKRIFIWSLLMLLPFFSFFLGYKIGFKKAQKQIGVKTETAKNNLQSHEQKMDTIRNEPDSAAMQRFLQNFGSKNKR